MNEAITWAALATSLSSIGWIWRVAFRFAESQSAATEAERKAAEAKDVAVELQTQVTTMNAAFALYRETAARESRDFVTRDMLRDIEQRIDAAVREGADRTAKGISELGDRIDKFVLAFADQASSGRRPRV